MYEKMAEILKEGSVGDFKLEKYEINNKNRGFMCSSPNGEYMTLLHKREVVMSDTTMEKRTNSTFVEKAHGDILIAGLGIGLIVLPIQDKEEVRTITIIEKNKEVIDLVAPQLPLNSKVRIINDDIFTWKPQRGTRYDVIYLDIWNYINSNVYKKEMVPLKNRFKYYLRKKSENPNRYIKCWAEFQAKTDRILI